MAFADLLASADVLIRQKTGRADVVYEPSVGDPVTVDGVFDNNDLRVDLGDAGVKSPGPTVFLALGDLTSDPETDADATVTIGATSYVIHEVTKDGLGGVTLRLHRA